MTNYASERSTLETFFSTIWTETPIAWGNMAFDPPVNDYWVRFTILSGTGFQASMGDIQTHRFAGQVVVQLFAPKNNGNEGLGRIVELSEVVVDMFSIRQFADIYTQFRVPYKVDVGEVDNWYQINVICPFYRNKYFAQ